MLIYSTTSGVPVDFVPPTKWANHMCHVKIQVPTVILVPHFALYVSSLRRTLEHKSYVVPNFEIYILTSGKPARRCRGSHHFSDPHMHYHILFSSFFHFAVVTTLFFLSYFAISRKIEKIALALHAYILRRHFTTMTLTAN